MKISALLHKYNQRNTPIIPHIPTYTKLILIALTIVGVSIFAKNIFAQNILKEKQDAIKKGNNQESWLSEAMGNNLFGVMTMVTGSLQFEQDGTLKTSGYVPGGMVGGTTKMVSSLYKAPASGVEYIAQIKDNFLGKPAYAQSNGVGFRGLQPILPAWRTLRNMTYVISSLLFIVIGIALMLRIKISPQAVITVQSALPKVITALILITFSYAISGLVIDMSNLLLSIVLVLFFNSKNIALNSNLFTTPILDGGGIPILSWFGNNMQAWYRDLASLWGDNPYNLTSLANSSFGRLYDLANRAVPAASGTMLGEVTGQIFLGTLLGGIGNVALGGLGRDALGTVGSIAGDVTGGIAGFILLPIVIAILMVFWLLKLYFGLLKCYITLIFRIIVAPVEIFMGALPNSKIGFSSWLISVIANISVFPITVIFLVFINYITDALVSGNLWIPSQIDLFTITGDIGGIGANGIVGAGVGLAGLAMLSKIPSLIPEFVFQIKPSPYGKAIGESFSLKTPGMATASRLTAGASFNAAGDKVAAAAKEDSGMPNGKAKWYWQGLNKIGDAAETMGMTRRKQSK